MFKKWYLKWFLKNEDGKINDKNDECNDNQNDKKRWTKYFGLALWLPFCHNSICSGTLALVLASAWNLPLVFPLVMILGADTQWRWSGHLYSWHSPPIALHPVTCRHLPYYFPLPHLFGEEGGDNDCRPPLAST